MYCSQCGAGSEEGDRYCSACGADLHRRERPRRWRLFAGGVAVTVALAAAIAIALSASGGDSSGASTDPYLKALDASCVSRNGEIVAAQARADAAGDLAAASGYADSLVAIAAEWRGELQSAKAPRDRAERVEGLGSALLETEVEAGILARLVRERNRPEAVQAASRVESRLRQVKAAASSLGLKRCAQLPVA